MIVFIGAIVILGGLLWAILRGTLPKSYWSLLLAGWCIGMVWELGFTFSGMGYPIFPGGEPNVRGEDLSDLPVPAILLILMVVSIWDAGLFVAGLTIARMLLGAQVERQFDWRALAIMLVWGQSQSLFIEAYAIQQGMWAYAATPLNPKLFDYGEAQLTVLPQLVWFVGMIVFYALVLRITQQRARG